MSFRERNLVFELGGERAEVMICRNNQRKNTVSLGLRHNKLVLNVPSSLSMKSVHRFIEEHNNWIHKHMTRVRSKVRINLDEVLARGWVEILGERKVIRVVKDFPFKQTGIFEEDGEIRIHQRLEASSEELATALRNYLKAKARLIIKSYLDKLVKRTKVSYNKFTIKDLKSRWGSCSEDNNLSFTWHIMLTDESILEYLVAHEFAHIVHKNHSKAFWNYVKSLMPEYEVHKDRLNIYSL